MDGGWKVSKNRRTRCNIQILAAPPPRPSNIFSNAQAMLLRRTRIHGQSEHISRVDEDTTDSTACVLKRRFGVSGANHRMNPGLGGKALRSASESGLFNEGVVPATRYKKELIVRAA